MTQPEVKRIAFADSFQVMANDDLSPGCRGNLGRIVRAIIGHHEQPIVFPHLRNNIVQRRSDPGALVVSWHQDNHRLANGVVCGIDGFFRIGKNAALATSRTKTSVTMAVAIAGISNNHDNRTIIPLTQLTT